MADIERIITDCMVRLVRQAPWGPNRPQLEEQAKALDAEAQVERGWDNYSTAAHLEWQAEMHRLAAEVRFPREGDHLVERMRQEVQTSLKAILNNDEIDEDVGERTRVFRSGLAMAIDQTIAGMDEDEIRAELGIGKTTVFTP